MSADKVASYGMMRIMFAMAYYPTNASVSFQEARVLRPWLRGAAAGPANANAAISTRQIVVPEILERSIALECQRHDAFRTRFTLRGDETLQRCLLAPDAKLFQLQQTNVGNALDDPAVGEQVAAFCKSPFRMDDDQWLRVLLIHVADGSSVLAFRMPHVVSDAASMRILVSGVWRHYEALALGETPANKSPRFSLHDYVGSQQAWAQSADFPRQLEALFAHTRIGFDRLRREAPQAVNRQNVGARPLCAAWALLAPQVQARFASIAAQAKSSVEMVLMAAAIVAVARISQQRDFCFRMPFSGRMLSGTEQIVGFLSNDLPMFVHIAAHESFASLVRRIQKDAFLVMRYGAVPWHLLNEQMSAIGISAAFDDYLINVIPSFESFGRSERFHTESFRIPATGNTSSILKVLMQCVDKGIRVTLRTGNEDRLRTEQYVLPEFVRVLNNLAEAPDQPLDRVLD